MSYILCWYIYVSSLGKSYVLPTIFKKHKLQVIPKSTNNGVNQNYFQGGNNKQFAQCSISQNITHHLNI